MKWLLFGVLALAVANIGEGRDTYNKRLNGDFEEFKKECRPDEVFKIDCNTCRCHADGKTYDCTEKACLPKPENDVKIKSSNKTIVCAANRMFIKDCNTCWCNEDGTSYSCTRRICIPEQLKGGASADTIYISEDLRIFQKECQPDEVFEIDCNVCRCNPDGKSFSCTRRACVPQPDDTEISSSASRDTRSTHLNIKDANFRSRMKRAVQLNNKEVPKTCQPGQEFRMDCNKCLCDNEGQDFSCTRIDCNALNNNNGASRRKRETTQHIRTACASGGVFQRDCNVCRCSADGLGAACTTHSCERRADQDNDVGSPASEVEGVFRCSPGEQFKLRCNDCTCSADGRSVFCTLRLCDKDLVPSI